MYLRWITPQGMETQPLEALPGLLQREDGFLWLDIPRVDARAETVLRETFHFHPLAIRECQERTPIPKIHVYQDHFFVVMHNVELGDDGKLHVIELDYFIHEHRYLVTVHRAAGSGLAPEYVCSETETVLARMQAGRFRPKNPVELGHSIVSALAHNLESFVSSLAGAISDLEHSVARGRLRDYEKMLDRMFLVRHRMQTVRTIVAQCREIHARMVAFSRSLRGETTLWLQDLFDQFDRLRNICDGERELMQEILDLYQTRVANDLSQLVRKLTAVGAILVADTLVAGIYGMNFKHMPELDWKLGYPMALGIMLVVSLAMAAWFRRKDWL